MVGLKRSYSQLEPQQQTSQQQQPPLPLLPTGAGSSLGNLNSGHGPWGTPNGPSNWPSPQPQLHHYPVPRTPPCHAAASSSAPMAALSPSPLLQNMLPHYKHPVQGSNQVEVHHNSGVVHQLEPESPPIIRGGRSYLLPPLPKQTSSSTHATDRPPPAHHQQTLRHRHGPPSGAGHQPQSQAASQGILLQPLYLGGPPRLPSAMLQTPPAPQQMPGCK